ncbi:hypothetical protein J1N35_025317 [Gossypium stocksii]|uniref:Uncharacterized protein n=1 Tax=Gossypium stocksii TaxID=47602 RepID=A0A9D3V6B5_9ROSI|nr:hypothetical protein J1N35_025317 [Gossypium stocksii]
MAYFLLPNLLCDNLDSIITNFLWQKGHGKKGIHWCYWRNLCTLKENDGLGFRNLGQFNITLVAKQAEAYAGLQAIMLGTSMGILLATMMGDSRTDIKKCQTTKPDKLVIGAIIRDIQSKKKLASKKLIFNLFIDQKTLVPINSPRNFRKGRGLIPGERNVESQWICSGRAMVKEPRMRRFCGEMKQHK